MYSVEAKNTFIHAFVEEVQEQSFQRTKSAPLRFSTSSLESPASPVSSSRGSVSSAGETVCSVSTACDPPAATGRLTKFAKQKDEVAKDQFTTVMIRNVPCKYTQEDLIDDIAQYSTLFNFVYLPPSKRSEGNVGYAFVNFATPEAAQLFREQFSGHSFPKQPTSSKIAEVVFAVLQGLRENMKFYKKSKVRKTDNRPYVNRDL
jgi:hypothetical protein